MGRTMQVSRPVRIAIDATSVPPQARRRRRVRDRARARALLSDAARRLRALHAQPMRSIADVAGPRNWRVEQRRRVGPARRAWCGSRLRCRVAAPRSASMCCTRRTTRCRSRPCAPPRRHHPRRHVLPHPGALPAGAAALHADDDAAVRAGRRRDHRPVGDRARRRAASAARARGRRSPPCTKRPAVGIVPSARGARGCVARRYGLERSVRPQRRQPGAGQEPRAADPRDARAARRRLRPSAGRSSASRRGSTSGTRARSSELEHARPRRFLGYVPRRRPAGAVPRRRRRSRSRRCTRASACRCSRRWPAGRRCSRRTSAPPRRSPAMRRCSSTRAPSTRSAMDCVAALATSTARQSFGSAASSARPSSAGERAADETHAVYERRRPGTECRVTVGVGRHRHLQLAQDIGTLLSSLQEHSRRSRERGHRRRQRVARRHAGAHRGATSLGASHRARDERAACRRRSTRALRASTGEFVAVLNPDIASTHDALTPLAQYLARHPDAGVVAPKLLDDDGALQLSCRAFPGYATALFSRYSLLTRLLPANAALARYLMSDFDHTHTIRRRLGERRGDDVPPRRVRCGRRLGSRSLHVQRGRRLLPPRPRRRLCDVVYHPAAVLYHRSASARAHRARVIIERHKSMWRYYRKHLRGSRPRDAVTAAGIGARCAWMLAAHELSLGARVLRRSVQSREAGDSGMNTR